MMSECALNICRQLQKIEEEELKKQLLHRERRKYRSSHSMRCTAVVRAMINTWILLKKGRTAGADTGRGGGALDAQAPPSSQDKIQFQWTLGWIAGFSIPCAQKA